MDNPKNEKTASPVPSIEVDFRAVSPRKNLVGFADLKIGSEVTIKDVRVLNGEYGIYAGMPSVQNRNGDYVELCHPVSADMKRAIDSALSQAYTQTVNKAQGNEVANLPQNQGYAASNPEVKLSVSPKQMGTDSNVAGFAQMNVGDHFVVKNIRLISGKNGMFPAMPTVPDGKGGYKAICEVSKELQKGLQKAARDGYTRAMNDGDRQPVSIMGQMKESADKIKNQPAKATPAKATKQAEH